MTIGSLFFIILIPYIMFCFLNGYLLLKNYNSPSEFELFDLEWIDLLCFPSFLIYFIFYFLFKFIDILNRPVFNKK